jgi:hypothetical protein
VSDVSQHCGYQEGGDILNGVLAAVLVSSAASAVIVVVFVIVRLLLGVVSYVHICCLVELPTCS